MTARRVGFGIGALLLTHNALRVADALLTRPGNASSGPGPNPFHYLAHMQFSGSSGAANRPWVLWVVAAGMLGLAAWFIWWDSRRNQSTPANPLWSSAFWSALSAAVLGLLMVLVATTVERTYGWALFVLLPMLMGIETAILRGRAQPATRAQCIGAASLSVAILGVILLGVAVEGSICLAMAAPLAVPLAILGGLIGHALQRKPVLRNPVTFVLLVGLAPFGATVEHALQPAADLFVVTTSIELRQSPERVWQTILQPASLPVPSQLLFRAGIAYPRASHIEGAGPAATRYCDFSTGQLVEPVVAWDHLRRLRFRVASNPLPMQEWTPYARIHPPHLDGFLVSRQGEFLLTPLPDGGTRLEASTWYQHHLWPAQYWRWWSDYIIHQVHGIVLENIRQRAE